MRFCYIACIEHGIEKTIDNINEQYHNHTKYHMDAVLKGYIHTSFSDNNSIAKRLLGLHILQNTRFNGPMDYDSIITKNHFTEKFVSFGKSVPDNLVILSIYFLNNKSIFFVSL